jgi:hypothetical protein
MHRVRDGLPPYGPLAVPFPEDWGRLGREGLVVEFESVAGGGWTGNFRSGLNGLHEVVPHPDGRRSVVFSGGDTWEVDPDSRTGVLIAMAVDARWAVGGDLVLSRQSLAFLRVGSRGTAWHTRRLSWDGFDDIRISGETLTGLAWSPVDDSWTPFSVDLRTGRSVGGSYGDHDAEGWERLAEAPG